MAEPEIWPTKVGDTFPSPPAGERLPNEGTRAAEPSRKGCPQAPSEDLGRVSRHPEDVATDGVQAGPPRQQDGNEDRRGTDSACPAGLSPHHHARAAWDRFTGHVADHVTASPEAGCMLDQEAARLRDYFAGMGVSPTLEALVAAAGIVNTISLSMESSFEAHRLTYPGSIPYAVITKLAAILARIEPREKTAITLPT